MATCYFSARPGENPSESKTLIPIIILHDIVIFMYIPVSRNQLFYLKNNA
uniref:Uncharacterized protein n=1 Tax=Arion vulgaris TaxID=1028688 RepID=A0A0B6YVY6_9EUPU